jgi:hypothetical protein
MLTTTQTQPLTVPAFAALLPSLTEAERAALAGVWVGCLTDRRARFAVRKAA